MNLSLTTIVRQNLKVLNYYIDNPEPNSLIELCLTVSNDKEEKNNEFSEEEDEFNVSLAAMEEEIKPKIILLISVLSKNYIKLIKYQREKLDAILTGVKFSPAKEKGYEVLVLDSPIISHLH